MLITDDFIFIHIPKGAGTSLSYALSEHMSKSDIFRGHSRHVPVHITFQDLQELKPRIEKDRFTFTFVRNPWDRMVSLYYYLLRRSKKGATGLRYRRPRAIALVPNGITFNHWILNLENIEQTPWEKKPLTHQQFNWAEGVDFVGRVENIQKDFDFVCNKLNLKCTLKHRNATPHDHYTALYTPESRDKIATIFAEDIERYGYKF